MMARVDRLDVVVGYLEEMRNGCSTRSTSPLSSSAASTPTRSRGSCRSAKEALQEAQAKGSLVDRIALLESRVLKMEEGIQMTWEMSRNPSRSSSEDKEAQQGRKEEEEEEKTTTKKKGLKSLVTTCVRGNLKTKD